MLAQASTGIISGFSRFLWCTSRAAATLGRECRVNTRARRRLILPSVLRGPLRLAPDVTTPALTAREPQRRVVPWVLLWAGACAGLYLLGTLAQRHGAMATAGVPTAPSPASNEPTTPNAGVTPPASLPVHPTPPTPALATQRNGMASATSPQRPQALKPLKDTSNLEVFSAGLRPPAEEPSPGDWEAAEAP
jgi:hypothetical protein